MKKILIILTVLFCLPSFANEAVDTQVFSGRCSEESVIVEGAIDHEKDTNEAPFFCDKAIVMFYDHDNKHLSLTFAQSHSISSVPLTFAGFMKEDGVHLDVDGLYIGTERYLASGGECQFFFKATKLEAIVCAARVDSENRKTMPLVEFVVQKP